MLRTLSLFKRFTRLENYTMHFSTSLVKTSCLARSRTDQAFAIRLRQFLFCCNCEPIHPIAGRGPWLVTACGAVLHDNGGYGMLGSGHGPSSIIDAMSENWVMANVMTPSFSQKRLGDRLRKELGHTRGSCPFDRFICMNSGSESVTVGLTNRRRECQTHDRPWWTA